jgi:uncharacterized membrane protein
MEDIKQEPEYIAPPPVAAAGSGLADNVAGALAYITIIPAIIFLVMEPYNRKPFIRFHAFQSLGLAVCWFACSVVLVIPILGWIVGLIGMLVTFCAWILCVVKAFGGEKFKLPIIGDFAEKTANS